MSLKRYSTAIDGTIQIQALLYDDEELQTSQDGVGIYDGQQKAPKHQAGVIYVTSHRLFFYSSTSPARYSFSLDLSHITQTDYYAGLFTSSAKVTLHLAPLEDTPEPEEDGLGGWECQVCSYRNPPGTSRNAQVCTLCGVPRSSTHEPVSTSLPTSRSVTPPSTTVACSACTFLNEPSLKKCEICGTALPTKRAATAPPSPALTAVDDSDPHLIKVSFRKGGDKPFYTVLKRSLQSKAWENRAIHKRAETVRGIDGLMRNAETSAKSSQTNMTEALKDLEAFMVKTQDMVRLAQDLNERLSASKSSSEPEEATFIRSSLAQLGLEMKNTPVTLDMIKDEKKWEEELVRELANVIQGAGPKKGIMKGRGIVALDEIWGGWNRARGVALIPPSTFLTTVSNLHQHTSPPLSTRQFPSGLTVLHTPEYSEREFAQRLIASLTPDGGKTTSIIAQHEGLGLGLVWEMIQGVEQQGDVVRDEGSSAGAWGEGSEVRWWANIFVGYVWDGQVDQ